MLRQWDCWDADALVLDKQSGVFADPDKVRYADYTGELVRTRGPLAMPRSPQGRPVFLQPGASPRGREFAGRWAEIIFAAKHTKEDSIAFTADIRQRVAAHGRDPGDCAVLNSMAVVVGETDAIAREKAEQLHDLADTDLVLMHNSTMIGADLAKHQTMDAMASVRGNQGIRGSEAHMEQVAAAAGISFAEAARRPRSVLVGTPQTVADQMQEVFEAGGCDGFIVWPTVSPNHVRGVRSPGGAGTATPRLVQTEYAPGTLQDRLRA